MTILLLLVLLILVLLSGIPVAIGLALVGVAAGYWLEGPSAFIGVPQIFYSSTHSFLITAIPMFVMMSEILRRAGVTEILFETVTRWLGHLPGGLAVSTVVTSAIGASITGSSVANAATMTMVAVPPMMARGYERKFTYGLIAASGTLGILIPPSIPLLLFAAITDVSVGRLFAAGLIPGLLLTAVLVAYVIVISLRGRVYTPIPRASWGERWQQTRKAVWALILPVIVIGGIYTGAFTATEAAGVGVLYATVLALAVYRTLSIRDFGPILMSSLETTCMILLLMGGATVLGHAVTTLQISQEMLALIQEFELSPWMFVLAVMILLFFLGMILEVVSIIFILLPVLYPILTALEIDPVWFAILFVVNMEIALITPPVGMILYVITGIVNRPIAEVIRGAAPYVAILILFLLFLMAAPQVSTWLPGLIY